MSVPMVIPREKHPPAGLGQRIAARLGLRLALAANGLPLRTRLRIADLLGNLPHATHRHTETLHSAVLDARGAHERRAACWETAFATQIACALTGRGTTLVLGVRPLPWCAHAWIRTPDGTLGVTVEDAERPWLPLRYAPARKKRI
jgi:hypothetical protein